uniref:ATPase subunit 8 n=1 Tax=Heterostelium pallidum TaxID=13642 RepID=B2XX35_HETPA|nr:ATPase subunit 8 [Heterostelium pallidum]
MPQLDSLIFFNEMYHLIVGFGLFYVLFLRYIITKLAYILKTREKFLNKKFSQMINKGIFLEELNKMKKLYLNVNYSSKLINHTTGNIKKEIGKVISKLKEI